MKGPPLIAVHQEENVCHPNLSRTSVLAFACAGITAAQTDSGPHTGPSNKDLIA